MARALSHDAKLIVMDEPSAVLDSAEVENLFRVIRQLTADGVAVVYISHRLDEIRDIGDRVTVLKDGRTVAVGLPARTTPTAEVVRLMTGRDVEYAFPRAAAGAPTAAEILRVEGLARRGEFADVSFSVHSGEIVGLAGLVGSGRSEIVETVYGARKPSAGTVTVDGRRLRPGSVRVGRSGPVSGSPRRSARARACCCTSRSTATSRCPVCGRFARGGFVLPGRELAAAARGGRAARRPAGRPAPAGAHAVRRQPAEGGAGPLAAAGLPAADPGRADPRRRRRRPHRDLPRWSARWPTAGSACCWSPARSRRCSGWPTGCWSSATAASSTRDPPARSTSPGSWTW